MPEIDSWRAIEPLEGAGAAQERYLVEHESDHRLAVLTLYSEGAEPDPDVYEVLRRTDLDHVPEIIAYGHWQNRPYEISEYITGGSLAELPLDPNDEETLRTIIDEIGRALDAFARTGLRHRDLRPDVVLVRDRGGLDLVITGFGSARLSEFDLDLASPLETTRYMAPEAVLGGVAAASDWWSLGMVLLEKVTRGACFTDINDQAFLIHALTHGVILPEDLDPDLCLLLRGLLARERSERWQWTEVKAWLDGEPVEAPGPSTISGAELGPAITLGGREYRRRSDYALAAAEAANWEEAKDQLLRGRLIAWVEETGIDQRALSLLRSVTNREFNDDIRLGIALKVIYPDLPLVHQGNIVTPGWLPQNAEIAHELITSDAPEILLQLDAGRWDWLARLQKRAETVRSRARHHEIDLNEAELRRLLLATSRANLAALWEERRKLLPDTDHRGLAAIIDRRQLYDEDLIILLSAAESQFRPIDEIVGEASNLARAERVSPFNEDRAKATLADTPRRRIFDLVAERIADFASCGIRHVDQWADNFRHDHRTTLARALVILAIPADRWERPAHQQYVSELISFFEQKVGLSIKRGALARMTIGKTSRRIDVLELDSARRRAEAMLNGIIDRSSQVIDIDPVVFAQNPDLEERLRGLHQQAAAYKKDSGIDGLYLGFPFLIFRPSGTTMLPRIAPILLWPVRIHAEVGRRGRFGISFDSDREEEISLNPAFEGFMGPEATQKWKDAADRALGQRARIEDIIDEFGHLAEPQQRDVVKLPSPDTDVPAGSGQIACSAVLFHAAFMAQALLRDLRNLKQASPHDTALEAMLRIGEKDQDLDDPTSALTSKETDRFFTAASDPSQEMAVFSARNGNGLVIEGPPGTGKSQTIVNVVCDTIGHKQSMLLVCQKHAALDVVRKRLEAGGLGDRIVMVTDVNRDRGAIISAIRQQVEELFRNENDMRATTRKQARERKRLGTRIEMLEKELNSQHQALHEIEPRIDRSYRDLVSELVALEEESEWPPIDCLKVRQAVSSFDLEELTTVEEVCAPLGPEWLAAEYENSPLAALRPFGWDEATLDAFGQDFREFQAAETNREAAIAEPPAPFGLDELSDQTLEEWIEYASTATAPISFWRSLSWRRFAARRRLRKLLICKSDPPSDETMRHFHEAALREQEVRAVIAERREASLSVLNKLDRWFTAEWIEMAETAISDDESLADQIDAIQVAQPMLPAYQRFRAKSQGLTPSAWACFAALRSVAQELRALPNAELAPEIRRILNREARLAWKAQMENANPVLLLNREEIATKIRALDEADAEMRRVNKQVLRANIDVSKLSTKNRWVDITRLNGPRRKSLREFVELGAEIGLLDVRPIWLVNPHTASRLFPLHSALFDTVVYDEASQMPVEHALPTLFRGRKAIVSGDEKQLPPTSFFASRIESDEAEISEGIQIGGDATEEEIEAAEEAWNRREIKDCPDVLALARAAMPRTMLEVHYRSRYRELIAYSNAAFYANRLHVPAKHPDDEIGRSKPIEVVRVDGLYQAQTNAEEASSVIELLAQYWVSNNPPSIGVVTFNRKQADLIEAQLEDRAEQDESFRSAYVQELNRVEGGEDTSFFVKNLENVQGDERDVILFSTTFGRNAQGVFRRFFGVLGQKGGERRLNVAVSRARQKVVLVTSMPVADVSDFIFTQRRPAIPRDYLQGYLHYAEHVSKGDLATARSILHQICGKAPDFGTPEAAETDGFAQTVAAYIRELGYQPEQAKDGTAFSLDFAIHDPGTGLFGIAIECDAPQHRLLAQARARELWRPSVLAGSVRRVHRVSSYGWYHDRDTEKNKLAEAIAQALA